MSGGRLLPAFGLGVADGMEHQAFGVERGERAQVVRRGAHRDAQVLVRRRRRPRRRALPLRGAARCGRSRSASTCGSAASPRPSCERVGRMADGWLPSFVTPADAAAGRAVIEQVAAEHDREIEDDHYGVLIPYTHGRRPRRPARPARPPPPRPRRPGDARARRLGRRRSARSSASSTSARPSSSSCRSPSRPTARGTPTSPPPPTPCCPWRRSRPDPFWTILSRLAATEAASEASARAAIAALRPGIAETPPPRRAPAPHTKTLGWRGLDAPAADVGGRSANGHCRSRWKMCPPGIPRSASISQRPHHLDAVAGRAGSPRSARRARCRASAGSTAVRRGERAVGIVAEQPGRQCAGANRVSVWTPAARSSGPRIVGSVSEWQ